MPAIKTNFQKSIEKLLKGDNAEQIALNISTQMQTGFDIQLSAQKGEQLDLEDKVLNAKTKVDDNFAKKLETDTLTKAISKLGFNADIFMGLFDDVKYLAEVTKEFAEKTAPIKLSEKAISQILDKGKDECEKYLKLHQDQKVELSTAQIEILKKAEKPTTV